MMLLIRQYYHRSLKLSNNRIMKDLLPDSFAIDTYLLKLDRGMLTINTVFKTKRNRTLPHTFLLHVPDRPLGTPIIVLPILYFDKA